MSNQQQPVQQQPVQQRLVQHCYRQFAVNATRIAAFSYEIDSAQSQWRPSPDAWSMVEVICHLRDEEREDFRPRLDVLLHRPQEPFPPTDPEGWVTARAYQDQDFQVVLAEFMDERVRSQQWLSGLAAPDWTRHATRPNGATLSAGDMLASWVAHDFLHMRQLSELHYLYHADSVQPWQVDYAGDW